MPIPKHEGSVMENLVDMRDHLKATRAAMQAGADPLQAASGHRNSAAPAADPKERRDLEEHLARDRASIAMRLEEAERDAQELRDLQASLEAVAAELSALPTADSQTIAALRFRYQQAAGRFSAMRANSSAAGGNAEAAPKTSWTIWHEAMPLVTAILLGSAILAGTLVYLLR